MDRLPQQEETPLQQEEVKSQAPQSEGIAKPYRPWLGRVDRYIIRTFLTTFVFSIALTLLCEYVQSALRLHLGHLLYLQSGCQYGDHSDAL